MNNVKLLLAFLIFSFIITSCKKETCNNFPPLVNAGKDTIIDFKKSASDTIKLNGEATDKDGFVVSYLWSLISGPNTVTIITPGSQSTFVSGVTSGTYVFQLWLLIIKVQLVLSLYQ